MFRLLSVITVTVAVMPSVIVQAAPRPEDKTIGPSVLGQAQSFDDLLKATKEMVKAIGGEPLYKAFERSVLPQIDPKFLPAIDSKRSFGLYGTLDADLAKCRGILLVPVTNEKDFVDMLDSFGIKTQKAKEEGVYTIETPPDVPFPVSFKVHKQYAYIALGGMDALDAKAIYDPNEIINDKEKALVTLAVRLDRIPKETKKAIIANLRESTEQLRESIREPELKDVLASLDKLYLRWLRLLFDEGKQLALRFEAIPKSGEVAIEITVEGLPKSPLAETFAKRQPTKNAFASLAGDDSVQRLYLTAPLFADEMTEVFVKLLDYGQREATKNAGKAPPESLKLMEAMFHSLKATVQSGDMDLAASFRGPNKEGFYNAVGAFHLKETANLEKAIREAVKVVPEPQRSWIHMDVGKIGTIPVHQIDFNSEADGVAKKLFGKGNSVYAAFGKEAVYVAYGPDGMKLLKEAVEAKPKLAASLDSWADGKRSATVIKKFFAEDFDKNTPEEIKGMFDAMSKADNATGFNIKIDGGEKLRIRVSYGAIGFGWMFMGFGVNARATFQQVAPAAGAVPRAKD